MPTCAVFKCSVRSTKDNVSFYRFPSLLSTKAGDYLKALSLQRRNAWIDALKRGPLSESVLRNGRVCSKHFISEKPAALEDPSNPDWIPNQNMDYVVSSVVSEHKQPIYSANSSLESARKRAKLIIEVQTDTLDENVAAKEIQPKSISKSVQTDLTKDQLDRVLDELNNCKSKIYTLQSKLESCYAYFHS